MNLDLIIGIAGVIGSMAAIFLALRKYPHESRNLDAQASKGFAEAAKLSEEAAKLSASRAAISLSELEEYKHETNLEIQALRTEINDLKAELRERDERLEDLRDWAERLVHQVMSLGGEPVKIRKRKKVE